MNNENNTIDKDKNLDQPGKTNEEQPLPFHNPLKPDDPTTITQEDIENEQKYKEALSERD